MYSFEEYDEYYARKNPHKSLKDRANESIEVLKHSLTGPATQFSTSPPLHHTRNQSPPNRNKTDLIKTVHPRTLTWNEINNSPIKPSGAAEQLRKILQGKETPVQVYEDVKKAPVGHLPTPEEAAVLLQNQSSLTTQLESENRYIKEELAILRLKLNEALEENKALHEELKTTVIHEIIQEGGDIKKLKGDMVNDILDNDLKTGYKKWQIELSRLSSLHAVKAERLEAQLGNSRNEVHRLEEIIEDLKSQLRIHDSIPTHDAGLSGDMYLTQSQRNTYQQTIDRITKERDELMEHITSLKNRLNEMTRREEEAYQQMKKGISLVETAQLEQTEALVEKEQLADELSKMRERFEIQVLQYHEKMESERESVRRECKHVIEDLNNKLKEVTDKFAIIQHEMERNEREKESLIHELDDVKLQLMKYDKETSMMNELYRTETASTTIHRSNALQDAARLRCEVEKLHRARDEDKSKMKLEIEDLRRRLYTAERELVNSKEECIHLTTNTQALERELHLSKLSKNSLEQTRLEDLKSITNHAKQRENELNACLAQMEDKHSQTQAEMETMLNRQNRLILKLRDECRKQATQLEKFSKKHRSEVGTLSKENEEMKLKFEKSSLRLATLDDQSDQHGRVHEKMIERMKIMDEHAQHQAQQIVEILGIQSKILRHRQILAREVEFLRSQFYQLDKKKVVTFCSGSPNRNLVDEILNTVKTEDNLASGLKIHSEFIHRHSPDHCVADEEEL